MIWAQNKCHFWSHHPWKQNPYIDGCVTLSMNLNFFYFFIFTILYSPNYTKDANHFHHTKSHIDNQILSFGNFTPTCSYTTLSFKNQTIQLEWTLFHAMFGSGIIHVHNDCVMRVNLDRDDLPYLNVCNINNSKHCFWVPSNFFL